MERAALFHRPDSEFAYMYDKEHFHVRLRSKRDDLKKVSLINGDPYLFDPEKWYLAEIPLIKIASTTLYDYWFVETTVAFKRIQYGFHLLGEKGEEIFYGDCGVVDFDEKIISDPENYFRLPYIHESDRVKVPSWVKETVWYQIFPERFANGDQLNEPVGTLEWNSQRPIREDFFGWDIQGVINRLDYLEELGVNGLYLCPIFQAESNQTSDTAFGDKQLLKQLVDEAHKRGMRVMLAGVFDYSGYFSKQWQDVLVRKEESPYRHWFYIDQFPVWNMVNFGEEPQPNLSSATSSVVPAIPKLNTEDPEVQAYLIDIACYWIKEFDIDGWCLDVANEVDHQFWKKFHQAVTALKPDIYLLGEIWHTSQNWLNGDQFHGGMNYPDMKSIQDGFIKKEISIRRMIDGLTEQSMGYRRQTTQVMFNRLDSQDTVRLLTSCGEDKDLAKMTLTFTFMQTGTPCIYYGTEVGMTGSQNPDRRESMVWETKSQDLDLLAFMKNLIDMRKKYRPFFSDGESRFDRIDDHKRFFIVSWRFGNEQIIGYFNLGEDNQEVMLTPTDEVLSELNTALQVNSLLIGENGFLVLKKGT